MDVLIILASEHFGGPAGGMALLGHGVNGGPDSGPRCEPWILLDSYIMCCVIQVHRSHITYHIHPLTHLPILTIGTSGSQ